jgi:hypothetical protein
LAAGRAEDDEAQGEQGGEERSDEQRKTALRRFVARQNEARLHGVGPERKRGIGPTQRPLAMRCTFAGSPYRLLAFTPAACATSERQPMRATDSKRPLSAALGVAISQLDPEPRFGSTRPGMIGHRHRSTFPSAHRKRKEKTFDRSVFIHPFVSKDCLSGPILPGPRGANVEAFNLQRESLQSGSTFLRSAVTNLPSSDRATWSPAP